MQRKIIVIGASGTIGKEVAKRLREVGHEVISVSRKSSDFQVDISDKKSLEILFKKVGSFDAVAITAGEVAAAPFESLTDENYSFSVGSKLMGQINAVRTALPYISAEGSFTLVSGVLTDEPILGGTVGTMINGAVEGFVKAASNELPKAVRINCISPTVLAESEAFHPFFPGFIPIEGWKVARAYERAISGVITGRIIKV